MALRTPDTKDEQDLSRNPSQEYYDEKFNSIVKGEQSTAKDLKERENGDGSDFKDIEAYANNPKNASKNIDSARQNEQAGGNWANKYTGGSSRKQPLTLKGVMKKKGPITAIIAVLGGGGVVLGGFGLTSMPVTFVETLTNDTNDALHQQKKQALDNLGNKPGNPDDKLKGCDPKPDIDCKANTMTKEMADRFEDEKKGNIKLEGRKEVGDRVAFSGYKFPDGEVVRNLGQLEAKLNSSLGAASAFNKAYNLKNNFFNRGHFFSNALGKLKLSKQKKIEGDNKEDAKKSFEASAKGEKGTLSTSAVPGSAGDDASEEERKRIAEGNESGSELSKTLNEGIGAGLKVAPESIKLRPKGVAGLGSLGCAVYTIGNIISVGAKVVKAARFAVFAMMFLTLAATIKAGVATDAEISQGMETLVPSTYPAEVENPETGEMIPNPNIGKNALDAEAYKVAAYGDQINLTGVATSLFIASGALGILQNVIDWMNDTFSREGIKTVCKLLSNPLVQVISFLAAPLFSAAILVLAELFPVDEIIAGLINKAIDIAAGIDLTTGVIGVDAGNVIFIGAAVIMGTAAAKFGMKPGKFSEIKKNMAANHQELEHEIAIAKYDASKTPLDITNRYSFLGSLAYQVAHFMPSLNSPLSISGAKLLSAFPRSLAMITKNAEAAYSMPVADYSETRFSQCKKDEAYAELGIDPDQFCPVRRVPYENMPTATVAREHMKTTNQIDKTTGNALSGTYLEKFTKFCAERTDPPGSSSIPVEEETEDTDWYTGKKCMEQSDDNKLSSSYIGWHHSQQIADMEVPAETRTAPSTTTPISGDARALALKAADNVNITFANEKTREQLKIFGNGGTVYDRCDAPMSVSKYLLTALLTNATKYKIKINNIGFREDRFVRECAPTTYQHPKGTGVDLNDIQILGGAGTGGTIDLPADANVVNQYATDFLKALPLNRGGVGQSDHGVNPTFPPGSIALNGSHLFPDAGDHLHIDARNRQNLQDTE